MIVNSKRKWKNVVKSRKLGVFTNDLMKETYYDKLYYIFLKLNSFKNDYIFFEQIFKVFQLCFKKSYSKFHSQILSHFSLNQKSLKIVSLHFLMLMTLIIFILIIIVWILLILIIYINQWKLFSFVIYLEYYKLIFIIFSIFFLFINFNISSLLKLCFENVLFYY